jgi:hypothetical protein
MFAKESLNDLAERRRLLLMEAELLRSVIGMERESLRGQLAGLPAAWETVRSRSPLWIAGGAVAGLLTTRHWRKLALWILSAVTALRWAQSLKKK